MKVLFVCTGNINRSAMAEAMARELIKISGITDIEVFSRGTACREDQPVSPGTAAALQMMQLSLDGHRSHRLTSQDVETADLILVMEEMHLKRVQELVPEAATKSFLLKEFAESEGSPDVADPQGGSLEDYEESRIEIQNALKGFLAKIRDGNTLPPTP